MKRQHIHALPLYPEQRECRFPTADRVLELFDGIQYHTIRKPGVVNENFPPDFTPLQKKILALVGVNVANYARAGD